MLKDIVSKLKERIAENTYLPSEVVEKLLSIEQNQNDIVYLYYPFLFNSVFDVEVHIVEDISLAGYYYYNSLIVLDRIYDESEYQGSLLYNIKNVLLLQEETIKILSGHYEVTSDFWKFWNQRKGEMESAFQLDVQFRKSGDVFSQNEYDRIADGKSAFGKVAVDSLFVLTSSQASERDTLLTFHTHFSIGNQLVDDLLDAKKDMNNGQANWINNELKKVLRSKSIKEAYYQKAIYLEGIASSALSLALDHFEKARSITIELGLYEWEKIIGKKIHKTELQLFEIENSVTVSRYRSSQSNTKVHSNTDVEHILSLGWSYIENRQCDDGSWQEYINQGGISNIWATAFILSMLPPLKEKSQVVTDGFSFLKKMNRNGLWSYNSTWIEDCDSTSFVMLALSNHNIKYLNVNLDKWIEYQLDDGGFTTYNNSHVLINLLNDKSINDVTGWCQSHPCVSAVALFALTQYTLDEKALDQCLEYIKKLEKPQALSAYWWTNSAYTFSFIARSLIKMNKLDHAFAVIDSHLVPFLVNALKEKREQDIFYIGLCLLALLEVRSHYENLIGHCIQHLIAQQYDDGSWPASNALLVPSPKAMNLPENTEEWSIGRYGVQIRCEEFNRLFSTSVSAKVLHIYREGLNVV